MSIFERDFLRRIIEDFARMLAAVVGLRRGGKFDEAEQRIADASGALLGPLAPDAELLGSESLAKLVSEERLRCYAALIAERANIREAKGDAAGAQQDRVRALELFLEVKAKASPGNAQLPVEARELLTLIGLSSLSPRYAALVHSESDA